MSQLKTFIFNQQLQQLHQRVHGLVSERAIVRLADYLESVADYGSTDPVGEGERLRSQLTYYQIARSSLKNGVKKLRLGALLAN